MTVRTICPNPQCGKPFKVSDDAVGRKARCKKCNTRFRVRDGEGELIEPGSSAGRPEGVARNTSAGAAAETGAGGTGAGGGREDGVPAVWHEGDVILDLYEVTGVLGEGGFGIVYRVHHKNWAMDLAVKCPKPDAFQTERQKENFTKEAETWVDLGLHPHIISCHYVRTLGGFPRVFAEYVDGGSLKDWLDSGKLYEGGPQKALERILDIAIQFAWGLHYAHEQGLIHQDVKPANVMLAGDGTAMVTDFGLAKARAETGQPQSPDDRQSILVSSGGMTPAYCSPEQANKEKLSRRTDLWSWAVSVFEMFAGDVTWPSGSVAGEAFEAYLEMAASDASLPTMPEGLIELLQQCFEHDPEQRPATMAEIAERLQAIYEETVGQAYPRSQPKAADLRADALNNRALSLLDLGRREEAEAAFEKALQADPHHSEATYNRGLIFWRSAQITDAEVIQQLEAIRTSHTHDWRDEYLLGRVHMERGDGESARLLCEAVAASEGDPAVQTALEQAERELGDHPASLGTFDGHTTQVNSVAFSPDGERVLSASGEFSGGDNTLRLWDTESGRCLRAFEGHTEQVTSVAFSSDGQRALSGSLDSTLRLWDMESGRCLGTFEGHIGFVESVAFSPNGRRALSGSGDHIRDGDNTLRLWDVVSGQCLRTFQGHTNSVNSVALSADGRRALSGSLDSTLRLWDVKSGRCLQTVQGHTGGVTSVTFSPDGGWALSGGSDKTLRLWDVKSGRCLRTFQGHTCGVTSVAFSPDGGRALSGGSDKTLRLWDVKSSRCLRTFQGHTGHVTSVAFSPDGGRALSGCSDKTLRLWDVARPMFEQSLAFCRPVLAAQLTERTRVVAQLQTQAERLIEAANGRQADQLISQAMAQPGYERSAELIALRRRAGLFGRVTGLSANWHVRIFEGHTDRVTSVTLSPDDRWILSGSEDKTLRLWDIETGRCQRTFEGHGRGLTSVAFSPDGRWALSGSGAKTLRLWDIKTGRCLRTFEGHIGFVESVAFSPDGRRALSASKTLRLWDIKTGRCLRTFEGHPKSVSSVAFSPDGARVLSGGGDSSSKDKTLRLWDVESGHCLQTFEGHTGGISSVAFSPDGRWAFSGGLDTTLRLWDIETGHCLPTFKGHAGILNSVATSPDGRWVLSGSGDKTLRLWEFVWDYEFPEPADWDEGARPYLQNFLTLHTPLVEELPKEREPTEKEIQLALTREGQPQWSEADFQQLITTLQHASYGWLRPEGVKRKLREMAANWTGPPAAFEEADGE